MAAMIILAWGADGAVPVKKTPTKSAAKKSTASAHRGGKKAPVSRVTWRNRQLAPTPDRYKEIQGALAAKGYLKPEDANGSWNQASADGLKRFQSEQNIESTGKINSLSLIALGLGPKHETPAVPIKPTPIKAPPEPGQPPPAIVQ
jgi:hypothetical protein